MIICSICGKSENITEINGNYYCHDCYDSLTEKCAECGCLDVADNMYEYYGYFYCKDCFEEHFVECIECGDYIRKSDAESIYDRFICENCKASEYTYCYICDELVHGNDVYYVEGYSLCPYCYDSDATTCDHCGSAILRDNAHPDEYIDLCDDCFRSAYYRCTECGNFVNSNYVNWHYDDPYCSDCVPETCIRDYSHKPTPRYYGGKDEYDHFMGVELEIDSGDDRDDCAEEILSVINSDAERVYCKYDGSLNEGFEIVSHPMTLAYHMTHMPWKKLMKIAKDYGFTSHDAGTCGLHIHYNRKALGITQEEQDVTIMKILFFIERFWTQIVKFSRRTLSQLNQYARRYGIKGEPKELLDRAKNSGRYYAVNLNNGHTIEFRMFRGTLNYVSFIATLQFVHELVEVMKSIDLDDLMNMTWDSFIQRIMNKYKELDAYLKQRGLDCSIDPPIVTSYEDASREEYNEDYIPDNFMGYVAPEQDDDIVYHVEELLA